MRKVCLRCFAQVTFFGRYMHGYLMCLWVTDLVKQAKSIHNDTERCTCSTFSDVICTSTCVFWGHGFSPTNTSRTIHDLSFTKVKKKIDKLWWLQKKKQKISYLQRAEMFKRENHNCRLYQNLLSKRQKRKTLWFFLSLFRLRASL